MAINRTDANASTLETLHKRWIEPDVSTACTTYCIHCMDEILPYESNYVTRHGRVHETPCWPEYAAERLAAELTWGTEDDV